MVEPRTLDYSHQGIGTPITVYIACAEPIDGVGQSKLIQIIERVVGASERIRGDGRLF